MYKLIISDEEGHTTVVPLLRDEITIGRQEGNTIRLTERNVSRRHARLSRRNGSYVVEDLGSYNGVSLNGERIDGRAQLSAGDNLTIGDYGLAFQSDAAATTNRLPSRETQTQPPPRLVVMSEPATGAEFTLNKPALRIGRDERLDIWINHKSISHEHAEIQVSDGRVAIFDLDSANGIRVNGIETSRAVLESGDVVELGEVRFRVLSPQGAHSLEALPHELPPTEMPSAKRKPVFVALVLALLLLATAGAVAVTLRSSPPLGMRPPTTSGAPLESPVSSPVVTPAPQVEQPASVEPFEATEPEEAPEPAIGSPVVQAPREWEDQLSRASLALAEGRVDEAYALASELPAESVLRDTPEFREILHRYAKAHLREGKRAISDGRSTQAEREARLVLGLQGVSEAEKEQAARLLRRARKATGAQNR